MMTYTFTSRTCSPRNWLHTNTYPEKWGRNLLDIAITPSGCLSLFLHVPPSCLSWACVSWAVKQFFCAFHVVKSVLQPATKFSFKSRHLMSSQRPVLFTNHTCSGDSGINPNQMNFKYSIYRYYQSIQCARRGLKYHRQCCCFQYMWNSNVTSHQPHHVDHVFQLSSRACSDICHAFSSSVRWWTFTVGWWSTRGALRGQTAMSKGTVFIRTCKGSIIRLREGRFSHEKHSLDVSHPELNSPENDWKYNMQW